MRLCDLSAQWCCLRSCREDRSIFKVSTQQTWHQVFVDESDTYIKGRTKALAGDRALHSGSSKNMLFVLEAALELILNKAL